jgi:hypothetical protein
VAVETRWEVAQSTESFKTMSGASKQLALTKQKLKVAVVRSYLPQISPIATVEFGPTGLIHQGDDMINRLGNNLLLRYRMARRA